MEKTVQQEGALKVLKVLSRARKRHVRDQKPMMIVASMVG